MKGKLKISAWKWPVLFIIMFTVNASGGIMKDMSFDEFREYLKDEGTDECEVFFDGKETSAHVTGHKYIFLQTVTYCGERDIMSSYRTWNSDSKFVLIYKNIRVELDRIKVRTFIEKTGSFKEKDEDDGRVLMSSEYGLIKNKKYYVKIASEEYHLPPDSEGGKPQKRTNDILWISDKPYKSGKPQVDLTPMYRGWSY